MKRLMITFVALSALLACNEGYKIETPQMTVVSTGTARAGVPVTFTITGCPDILTFYSGERGNDWSFKDADRVESPKMYMSFMTTTSSGTPGNANPSSLPIFYSTDFSGEYTEAGVNAATWIEITDRFDMPTDTEKTNVPSGMADIDDVFPADGSPVYLMMSYFVEKFVDSQANGRTQWTVQNMNLYGGEDTSAGLLYDMYSSGWQIVGGQGAGTTERVPDLPSTNARILFRSDFRPTEDIQFWAVSGPLTRAESVNLGQDKGVPVKSVADPALRTYRHVYTEPGEYTATFVGANSNVYSREETVCHVKITVEEALPPVIDPAEFAITAQTLECKAGEPVEFTFAGEAETVEFWSGEIGHDYLYSETERGGASNVYMQFKSVKIAGNQPDNLRVRYSSDFSGTMTEEEIMKAKWTDITDRFTIPDEIAAEGNPNSGTANFAKYVDSGSVPVNDCVAEGPVWFAMFYEIDAYDETEGNSRTVTWICGWKVLRNYDDGSIDTLFDLDESTEDAKNVELVTGASYSGDDKVPGWYTSKSGITEVMWHFRFFSHFTPDTERKAYAVMKTPVSVSMSSNGGKDIPIAVKSSSVPMPQEWSYTYTSAGVYTAVFTVVRLTDEGPVNEIRQFVIKVK